MYIDLSKQGWKYRGCFKAKVSTQDDWLSSIRWSVVQPKDNQLYAYAFVNNNNITLFGRSVTLGQHIYLHRYVMALKNNCNYNDVGVVDHKNRNGLDCTRRNLRIATVQENMFNRKVRYDSKTGLKNIQITNGKYLVRVSKDGKSHLLKCDTQEQAIKERNKLLKKLHGVFARFE